MSCHRKEQHIFRHVRRSTHAFRCIGPLFCRGDMVAIGTRALNSFPVVGVLIVESACRFASGGSSPQVVVRYFKPIVINNIGMLNDGIAIFKRGYEIRMAHASGQSSCRRQRGRGRPLRDVVVASPLEIATEIGLFLSRRGIHRRQCLRFVRLGRPDVAGGPDLSVGKRYVRRVAAGVGRRRCVGRRESRRLGRRPVPRTTVLRFPWGVGLLGPS